MTPRTDPPGLCCSTMLMVALLAVCFAGFGLAAWQNEAFRADVWYLCLTCGIMLLLGTIAVAVITNRK